MGQAHLAKSGEYIKHRSLFFSHTFVAFHHRKRERTVAMRKFDPWPVFFKREWKRCWPFLVGFAVTGTIVTKMSLGLTGITLIHHPHFSPIFLDRLICFIGNFVRLFSEEDAAKSPFAQRHKKRKFTSFFNLDANPRICFIEQRSEFVD